MTVYITTDYRIGSVLEVFDTREAAEAYKAHREARGQETRVLVRGLIIAQKEGSL